MKYNEWINILMSKYILITIVLTVNFVLIP